MIHWFYFWVFIWKKKEHTNQKRHMRRYVHFNITNYSQDMKTTKMSINRWMHKEEVVHVHNGILLSHKKKQNWVICSEVDGPRVCHTEWSKSTSTFETQGKDFDFFIEQGWPHTK